MAVSVRSAHPQLLWPGVHSTFGHSYMEIDPIWAELFDIRRSTKHEEKVVEITGFGLALEKSEASAISYDESREGATSRFRNITWGLGFIASMEEIQDGQYKEVAQTRAKGLAFSHRQTEEEVHANIFRRAFNSSFAGGDGQELVSADHPTRSGNQSNYLATPADLSERAIEDLTIDIMNVKNARGLRINLQPKRVIVGPDLSFDAARILASPMRSGTGNNDINALRSMGLFKDGAFVHRYMEDDSWFIQTNCPNGLIHFERMALELEQDNDFDTKNARASAIKRYVAGWADWRCLYGSEGV